LSDCACPIQTHDSPPSEDDEELNACEGCARAGSLGGVHPDAVVVLGRLAGEADVELLQFVGADSSSLGVGVPLTLATVLELLDHGLVGGTERAVGGADDAVAVGDFLDGVVHALAVTAADGLGGLHGLDLLVVVDDVVESGALVDVDGELGDTQDAVVVVGLHGLLLGSVVGDVVPAQQSRVVLAVGFAAADFATALVDDLTVTFVAVLVGARFDEEVTGDGHGECGVGLTLQLGEGVLEAVLLIVLVVADGDVDTLVVGVVGVHGLLLGSVGVDDLLGRDVQWDIHVRGILVLGVVLGAAVHHRIEHLNGHTTGDVPLALTVVNLDTTLHDCSSLGTILVNV